MALLVHNLRTFRVVPFDRLLCATVHVAGLSEHKLCVDLLIGAAVFVIDYHVRFHDNTFFRQVKGNNVFRGGSLIDLFVL